MRTIIEHLSRGVVLKRKLPKRFSSLPIYVSPDSALKFWFKNFEGNDVTLLKMCTELVQENSVVWDIGANVGVFAFAAAALAGPQGMVLAVEPDLFLTSLLQKTTELQRRNEKKIARVDILPMAISDQVGVVKFNIAARGRSTNFLDCTKGVEEAGGIRETTSVMSVTLDWLVDYYPAPDVVKIDVETAEFLVLKGATRLLREIRPVIFCEIFPFDEKRYYVEKLMKENNYILYNARDEHSKRIEFINPDSDVLAVPQ